MLTISTATKIIKLDEESNVFKSLPYYCSKNYPTIGWGFRIEGTKQFDPLPNITMTKEEGDRKLSSLISDIYKTLSTNKNTSYIFNKLNYVRQSVLISMCYQLGFTGLMGFKDMWQALDVSNFDKAAIECLDSKAYREDTPERFARNAEQLKIGILLEYYN